MTKAREIGRAEDERWHLRKDGTRFWASGLMMRFEDEGTGEHIGYLKILRDRTEHHQASKAARAGEERLRAALEASGTGTFRWDIRTNALEWDEALDRLFGLAPGQTARSLDQFLAMVHPDDHAGIVERCERCAPEGADFEMEFRVVWPDGGIHWLYDRGKTVRDDDGKPAYMAGACVDISERKRAEDALRASEAYLRLLLDSTAEGFYSVDREGTTTLCNAAFLRMLGFEREEDAIGRKLHNLIHHSHPDGSHYPRHDCPIYRTAQTGEPAHVEGELFFRLDGASFPVEYRVHPIRPNGELQGAICTFVDVTERKRAEAALRASNDRFRAAVDAVQGVLWTNSAAGMMEGEQPGWAALTGQSRDEYQGYGWSAAVHPDYVQATIDAWNAAVPERRVFAFEHRVRCHDGVWRRFSIRAIPIFDADGELREWVGVHTDVTDQRASEEALREETRTLETLNRTGAALAGELDLERIVQMVTDAGVELTGAAFGRFFYNVLDEAGESYMLYTLSGVDRSAFERFPMPRNTAVFAPTFKGEGVVRSDDILADPRYGKNDPHRGMPEGHLPVRSYLAVPVTSRSGEVTGGLFFGHPEPGRFNERHERLMVGMAAQAAIAIDNARLFRAAQRELDERRRTEERLRDSEEQLSAIFSQAAAGLVEKDLDGRFLRMNDRYCEIVGRTREELIGMRTQDITHPDDLPRNAFLFQRAIEAGEPFEIEKRYCRPDGSAVWVNNSVSPIRDAAGRPLTVLTVSIDITERKTAGEALRLRGEEFYALADNIPTLCWIVYANGHIFWYNRRWYEYTGTSPESQEGWGWEAVHDPEQLPGVVARWKHSLATGEPFEMTFPLKGADGVFRPFLTQIVPIRDEQGRIVRWFGTNVDVSEHVKAERLLERRVAERTAELQAANERLHAEMEERQSAEEQLRQAQKMEAVGQLTGGIAHDFNNLLTGVIGSLDMLQRRVSQGRTGDIERYASAAMTAANRAAALTHRLLAFSRRQPLDPKPVNANRLVTGMEELLRRTIGEAVRLEIVTAGGLWLTRCDPHQLESAILNLAINARDAMPKGGKLTIETCNAHLDNAYAAQQREVRPGQYICICVTDTGTGMTPDVIAKAFDPFFTTKPIGQGTGLGLSMIYGFARQSEGYARIYSEVGQGTTVKLYLPRYYGATEHADEGKPGLTEAHRAEHGEVVLVVEDEAAVRDLVVDVLEELGYRAVEAADGPSGLKLLQSDLRVDLLVTDVGLPGLNGRQLADAGRRQRPGLKVLFMTGYAENATIANGFLEPGMQMITKPFAIEALAARIRDMIESA